MTLRDGLTRARAGLTLPLFVKELTEAAARRRTYVVRTAYAGTLFLLSILFARDVLFPSGDAFATLGRGGELYATVVMIQFGGIYLFLPALTAASITAEKERNTLGLLFLTKLSPTKIVLEKFLGRVFPMLCLTLLSLPLLGVAYTLGGLTFELLFEGIVRLAVTILMVGAIGVACSAWCRTTAGAFLSTYAVLFALFPGPIFVMEALGIGPGDAIVRWLGRIAMAVRLLPIDEDDAIVGLFFGPLPVVMWLEAMNRQVAGIGAAFLSRSPLIVLWQATPLLLPTAAALVTARLVLVARSEVKPKRFLARAFKSLDVRFRELNDRYANGIEVIKTHGSLPEYAPIAWRETTKTTLGSFRYLVRMFLIVEVPILFVGLLAAGSTDGFGTGLLDLIAFVLWLATGLLVAAKASGLFPGEKARQTLDVLLTTPLTTRTILREKLAGVWRLILVSAVPMMSTWILIAYLKYSIGRTFGLHAVAFVGAAAAVVVTHLALVTYVSLIVGLRVPTQSRAVLMSVTILTVLCLAWPITRLVWEAGQGYDTPPVAYSLYSPASVVIELLEGRATTGELLLLLTGSTVLYGGLALALRWVCYLNADTWLGREENEPPVPITELPRLPRVSEAAEAIPQPAEAVG